MWQPYRPKLGSLGVLLVFLHGAPLRQAFVVPNQVPRAAGVGTGAGASHRRCRQPQHSQRTCSAGLVVGRIPLGARSNDDDNSSNNNDNNLDDWRQSLEAAWQVDAMGPVPTTPQAAAQAASLAVRNAWAQHAPPDNSNNKSVCMVDILLPQYDASQGDKVYDEVLAVEFCIHLAQQLETQTSIVVRDDKVVQTVRRILDRREQEVGSLSASSSSLRVGTADETDANETVDTDHDDGDEDEDDEESTPTATSSTATATTTTTDDIDSFRAKLAADWNLNVDDDTGDDGPVAPNPGTSRRSIGKNTNKTTSQVKLDSQQQSSHRLYRLCSMLGDGVGMGAGPDMPRRVMAAVQAHALPQAEDETIIILSAASPAELVGIRALVSQYESTKKMILVNCQTNPLPRELVNVPTVYSILPLVAKQTSGSRGTSSGTQAKPNPRIVVLRRFPRDWEIFVDYAGTGFALATTAPASPAQPKGPTMTWIVQAVSRFLATKTR